MMSEFQIQLVTRDEQVLQFNCLAGEDIVSAAERAELYLISQCRSGSCGACIGTATRGQYVQDIDPDIANSIAHTEQVLLCRTYPRSDLQVVLPYDANQVRKQPLPMRQATLLEKNYLTPDTLQLKLQLIEDEDGNLSLAFEPGQYIEIWIPQTEIKRAYSIANAPNWDGVLELLIKLRSHGQFAQYITEQAQVGDVLTLQGASGNFTLQDRGLRPRYFIAGGCGLASVMAMVRQMAELQEPHEVQLLFGVWREEEVFYQSELAELAADYPNLHYQICVQDATPTWQGFHGSVADAFKALMQNTPTTPDIYICGSNGLIERVAEVAATFNISKDQLIHEHYGAQATNTSHFCQEDSCSMPYAVAS